MNIRALALGAVVGFVVAFAPSCSPAKCGPQNCDGCCDAKGVCTKKPNNLNNTTCGSAGNACIDCTATAATCNAGVCSGTGAGGGSGGGGGGTTGGGGGTTCDGCRLPNGQCVPSQTSSSNTSNCGIGNVACAACNIGELCTNGTCMMPPPMARVGSACSTDAECQATLGAAATCRTQTVTGSGTYPGGYCTIRCSSAACPSGSTCVRVPDQFGEEAVCWDNCGGTDMCRSNYRCYPLNGGTSACWLQTLPTVDAGTPADKVGNTCTADSQCQNPPETGGACLTREFNYNWQGGYCTKLDCLQSSECATDGGSICLTIDAQDNTACVQKCADSSDGGQSTCRNGYVCNPFFTGLADGGQQQSVDGYCSPPPAPTPSTIGAACATDMDCQVPTGAIADCLPGTLPDGGPSGFTGGECTRFGCQSDTDCSLDGGAQCFGIGNGNTACFKGCAVAGSGQSDCRAGFVCSSYGLADGGRSTDGVCDPSCAAAGAPACAAGTTCNGMGYCR